jgi:hypothetical protein
MAHVEAYRDLVVARAAGVCEYCRLMQAASGVLFHIEHVLPRSRGGKTILSNLALACPGCNLAKSDHLLAEDLRGEIQSLFNPREFEPWLLGWHLHFVLDRDSGLIVPRTPMGEATVKALKMNDTLRVFARKLQISAGLIA